MRHLGQFINDVPDDIRIRGLEAENRALQHELTELRMAILDAWSEWPMAETMLGLVQLVRCGA